MLPLQFLLDYTLPFTALGLVSFRNRKYGFQIGSFISIGVRTICHVLSGVLFFGEYAAEADLILLWRTPLHTTYPT